jgi:hypothetical protein
MPDIIENLRSPDFQGPAQHLRGWDELDRLHKTAADEIDRLRDEVKNTRLSVVAFAGPAAAEWAKAHGLPAGHLHPTHYDILARAGARMVDFTRYTAPIPLPED